MATWKKVAVSGSNISQFNNDSGYLTSATSLNAFSTASFNGTDLLADSSQGQLNFASGSGQGLTISATAGTDTLTFGLSSIPNTSLENDGITIAGQDTSLGGTITADTIAGQISSGTITNTQLENDSITFGTDDIALGAIVNQLNITGYTGSFTGSFTGDVDIDLADLTAGAGLFGSAYDGNDAREFSVDSGSLAGDGLTTDAVAGTFEVQADSTTGGNTVPVSVGTNGVGLDVDSIDGTGLTANAGVLDVDYGSTAGTAVEGDTTITVNGTTNAIDITGTAAQALGGAPVYTVDLSNTIDGDRTFTNDVIVSGDLTVQGTASFQNTEELQVADRFVLFASGSNTEGDGGIVVQQGTQNIGELFAYDSATTRWGLTSSFDASTTAYTPDAFMAAVIEGTDDNPDNVPERYDKKGNIFVGATEGEIWIYG